MRMPSLRATPWGTARVAAIALAALAIGCGGGQGPANPVAPAAFSSVAAAAGHPTPVPSSGNPGKVARDIGGVLAGRFDFTNTWGDEWWEFYSDSLTTGTVTHLGLSELRTRHVPEMETGALTQGTFTLVAANGDEITGTYEGMAWYDEERPDLVHGQATFMVSGGTGRFEHATGRLTATLLEVLDDPTWASAGVTWTLEGTITY